MKEIRKIVSGLVFLFALSFASHAQVYSSENYGNLVDLARNYESSGEYFYAYATYYDALASESDDHDEALQGFENLQKRFAKGFPGMKAKYNSQTLHDEYLELIRNADKYWTEFYPQANTLAFIIRKENTVYGNGTKDYTLRVKVNSRSRKYHELMESVERGLQKSWKSSWNDIPKNWPAESLEYDADSYSKYGVASYNRISKINSTKNYDSRTKRTTSVFGNVEYDSKYTASWIATEGFRTYSRTSNFNASEEMFNSHWSDSPYTSPYESEGLLKENSYTTNGDEDFLLTEIEFNIVDKNGTVLIPNQSRFMLGTNKSILLKNVVPATAKILDTGNFRIQITKMYMSYGKPNSADIQISSSEVVNTNGTKYTSYSNYPLNRSFVNSLSRITYTNPRTIIFTANTDIPNSGSSFYETEAPYYKYRKHKAIPELANRISAENRAAKEKELTEQKIEGFSFIPGEIFVGECESRYFYDEKTDDYHVDSNGNYILNPDYGKILYTFIPGFYINDASRNEYEPSESEVEKTTGIPKKFLKSAGRDQKKLLAKKENLNDYELNDFIYIPASKVTKEFMEEISGTAFMISVDQEFYFFSNFESSVEIPVSGKKLSDKNIYITFENSDEHYAPSRIIKKMEAIFSMGPREVESLTKISSGEKKYVDGKVVANNGMISEKFRIYFEELKVEIASTENESEYLAVRFNTSSSQLRNFDVKLGDTRIENKINRQNKLTISFDSFPENQDSVRVYISRNGFKDFYTIGTIFRNGKFYNGPETLTEDYNIRASLNDSF